MTRKPRVVTFRLDQATWDRMREVAPYTKYGNTSSFIRESIELAVANGLDRVSCDYGGLLMSTRPSSARHDR
jgi:hypothetical protein